MVDSVDAAALSWTLSRNAETCSTAEATQGHSTCVHAAVCGMKLADQGITSEPRGLTASQPRPVDIYHRCCPRTQCGPGCVWPPPLQRQLAGHAAQAAFDRKRSHYRNEIGELRQQGIQHRPLISTTDRRPHPAVTRTLQHAASIASSWNGQQMSAKSLHRRW